MATLTQAFERQWKENEAFRRAHKATTSSFVVNGEELIGRKIVLRGLRTSPVWALLDTKTSGHVTLLEMNSGKSCRIPKGDLRNRIKTGMIEVLS